MDMKRPWSRRGFCLEPYTMDGFSRCAEIRRRSFTMSVTTALIDIGNPVFPADMPWISLAMGILAEHTSRTSDRDTIGCV